MADDNDQEQQNKQTQMVKDQKGVLINEAGACIILFGAALWLFSSSTGWGIVFGSLLGLVFILLQAKATRSYCKYRLLKEAPFSSFR